MPLYYAQGVVLIVEARDEEMARAAFDDICGQASLFKGCEGVLFADHIQTLPAPTDWFNHDIPEELT